MPAVNSPPDDHALQTNWASQEDQTMSSRDQNPASMPVDDEHTPNHNAQDPESSADRDYPPRGSSVDASVNGSKADNYRGEKQVKPNKVYIGGLPENTREEDLQNCFGKIGKIINIELKVGYGFVEFDQREAAEESVAKYHEGYFMGQKIRVELSHGGGRTAKYAGEPGACFRCGQQGHWARECPNQSQGSRARNHDSVMFDRAPRDYPPRSLPPRDDYSPRYPPPRDLRYDYPPPPPRDYRRPPSPSPRDYRDYPVPPMRGRDYDDYRRGPPPPPLHERDRYAPVAPPPPGDYGRGRYPPPVPEPYRGYSGAPVPPPVGYDRYDRRPAERYPPSYPPRPPSSGRGRSPPPRDYDRGQPPREYSDYRGRPASPPRYPPGDFGPAGAEPPTRYRRRSVSPVPVRSPVAYDPYSNGYSGNAPPAGRRDYPPPPPRSGRDIDPAPYRRQ